MYETESKSTDKLMVLIDGLKNMPKEKLMKVKTFDLNWRKVGDDEDYVIVPCVKVTFKD